MEAHFIEHAASAPPCYGPSIEQLYLAEFYIRWPSRAARYPILTEYSPMENKECAAKIDDKNPCTLFAVEGSEYCAIHRGMFTTKKREPRYSHLFKSQKLREAYERLLNDPEISDLSEELALSRVLLAGTIAKIDNKSMEELNADDKAAIAIMLDQVCKAAEAMGKMEKYLQTTISVAQLGKITEQAARIFYREIMGIVDRVRDEANAKEIKLEIPQILHRIASELSDTDVPFSPARWMKQHGDEPVPAGVK